MLEGLGFIEVPYRSIHIDWQRWVAEGICDTLVVGAGGIELWNIPWDDIIRVKYLPVTHDRVNLWAWMRIEGYNGYWKLKPPGAIRREFRDVAAATAISGVVWHEAYHWYNPECATLLWEQLAGLRARISPRIS